MKKLELNKMEGLNGGYVRPNCDWNYAGFALASAALFSGPGAILVFGGLMLYCK